jgi:hypothetical protein
MDNVTALRQMDLAQAASGASAGVVLFKPADAVRARPSGFTGTPMPKDEPMAANPPDGAAIDYLLPAGTPGPVTLTLFNARMQKIWTFTSADKTTRPDASKLGFAPEWLPPQAVLAAGPGMHRFVWDLHYPGALDPENPFKAGGVWAPPGSYFVELSAHGQTLRQPLTLKPDPRVKIPPAALEREFELASKVHRAAKQGAKAIEEATGLLKVLTARAPHETKLRPAVARLMAATSDVSGLPLPTDKRAARPGSPAPPGSLKDLSKALDNLESAVDGADADPSADARAAYAKLTLLLAAKLQRWQNLKQRDLAALDAAFVAQGEKPVQL